MTIPAELAKVDLVWSIDGGPEIAVNTFWMQHHHGTSDSFAWSDALQTIADHWVTSVQTITAGGDHATTYMASNVSLSRVDAYQIGTDGKATDKASHAVTAGTIVGGETGAPGPTPFAAVLQLDAYTGYVTHKRRRTGRVFLPVSAEGAMGSDGLISRDVTGGLATIWGAILNDIQGMHVGDSGGVGGGPTDWMNVGVFSRVDGTFYQLESVRVSNKPGWQRRRMNKLAEAYGTPTTIAHS